MHSKIESLKTAWNYFLYHPDKTEVIIQVYVLNKLFSYIEIVVFWVINSTRSLILKFKK